jgi:hypothetical protein
MYSVLEQTIILLTLLATLIFIFSKLRGSIKSFGFAAKKTNHKNEEPKCPHCR